MRRQCTQRRSTVRDLISSDDERSELHSSIDERTKKLDVRKEEVRGDFTTSRRAEDTD